MPRSLRSFRRRYREKVNPWMVGIVGAVMTMAGGMLMLGPSFTPVLLRWVFLALIYLVLGFLFGAIRPDLTWRWGLILAAGTLATATFAFGSARWVMFFLDTSRIIPPLSYGWALFRLLVLPALIAGPAGALLASRLPDSSPPFRWLLSLERRVRESQGPDS